MRQSPLEIIWSIVFGAAMSLAVACAIYTLMLAWDRLARLFHSVAGYVVSLSKRRSKPPSSSAKPNFTLRRTR